MHKMIKVLHALAFPIVFILFYDRYWQRGVIKFIKNDHVFSIFNVLVFFPKFLVRLKGQGGLY